MHLPYIISRHTSQAFAKLKILKVHHVGKLMHRYNYNTLHKKQEFLANNVKVNSIANLIWVVIYFF